jgi:hypothetical protein
MVFAEMSQALCRGEYVEFPFGYLKAEKGRRWEAPLRIEHIPDDEGWKLLEGETGLPWTPGWSRKVDKRSFVYLWDRALEQARKDKMNMLKRIVRKGKRKLLAVNDSRQTGK